MGQPSAVNVNVAAKDWVKSNEEQKVEQNELKPTLSKKEHKKQCISTIKTKMTSIAFKKVIDLVRQVKDSKLDKKIVMKQYNELRKFSSFHLWFV